MDYAFFNRIDRGQGQGPGINAVLVMLRDFRRLDIARNERWRRVVGMVSSANRAMLSACRKLGFKLDYDEEERIVHVVAEPG